MHHHHHRTDRSLIWKVLSLIRVPNREFLGKKVTFPEVFLFKAQILPIVFKFIHSNSSLKRRRVLQGEFVVEIISISMWIELSRDREEGRILYGYSENISFMMCFCLMGNGDFPRKFLSLRWQLPLRTLPETVLGSLVCFSFLCCGIIKKSSVDKEDVMRGPSSVRFANNSYVSAVHQHG